MREGKKCEGSGEWSNERKTNKEKSEEKESTCRRKNKERKK